MRSRNLNNAKLDAGDRVASRALESCALIISDDKVGKSEEDGSGAEEGGRKESGRKRRPVVNRDHRFAGEMDR